MKKKNKKQKKAKKQLVVKSKVDYQNLVFLKISKTVNINFPRIIWKF